jgi:hypothetical protein
MGTYQHTLPALRMQSDLFLFRAPFLWFGSTVLAVGVVFCVLFAIDIVDRLAG